MRGSIKKRGATWYVVYDIGRDPITGKRNQKKKGGFKTKKEAEGFIAEQINSLEKGVYINPSDMTFGEYLDYWLDNYAKSNTSPKTFEVYDYMINTHIKPSIGKIELSKLLPLHLQNYYIQKLENGRKENEGGLSAQSVKHHHRVISKALSDAVKWQFIMRNVADAVNPPKPKKVEMITLDAEEVSRLLQVAETSQYFSLIYSAVHTGMRRGELLGLRWKDVELENKVIHVRQSIQQVTGEGLIIKEPKSGKGRSVSMTDSLVQILSEHKVAQSKNQLLLGDNYFDNDLVFTQANGRPFSPPELTRQFNKIVKMANVTAVRFHDLRHTHATLMLKAGIHPKIVSERLGHSTVGITLDIYTHVLPNMQKEAADQFEKVLIMAEQKTKEILA